MQLPLVVFAALAASGAVFGATQEKSSSVASHHHPKNHEHHGHHRHPGHHHRSRKHRGHHHEKTHPKSHHHKVEPSSTVSKTASATAPAKTSTNISVSTLASARPISAKASAKPGTTLASKATSASAAIETGKTNAAANPKKGIPYAESDADGGDMNQANQTGSALTWVYNWGVSPPSYLAESGLEYVPMQWGLSGADSFASTILAMNPLPTYVLGFNEPDLSSQSNISPADAATAWMQYIEPLSSHGIKLGAPAVTNGNSLNPPMGTNWLSQFYGNCTQCTIDFVPFHWYGDGVGSYYDYIWSFHGQFPNASLWATEFASTNSDVATVLDFLNQTTIYMDSLDWIERYAWFPFSRADGTNPPYQLLDNTGKLNELGNAYVLDIVS